MAVRDWFRNIADILGIPQQPKRGISDSPIHRVREEPTQKARAPRNDPPKYSPTRRQMQQFARPSQQGVAAKPARPSNQVSDDEIISNSVATQILLNDVAAFNTQPQQPDDSFTGKGGNSGGGGATALWSGDNSQPTTQTPQPDPAPTVMAEAPKMPDAPAAPAYESPQQPDFSSSISVDMPQP